MKTEKQLKAIKAQIRKHQKALLALDKMICNEMDKVDVEIERAEDKKDRARCRKLESYANKLDKIDSSFVMF